MASIPDGQINEPEFTAASVRPSSESEYSNSMNFTATVAGPISSSDTEAVIPSSLDPPENGGGNADGSNAAKKPAWKKVSNTPADTGPVIDDSSWPALGEAARASPKLSSLESLESLADKPASPSKGPVTAAAASTDATANSNSSPSNVGPTGQRSINNQSSSTSSADNGDLSQPRQRPEFAALEAVSNAPAQTGCGDSSSRGHVPEVGGRRAYHGSQSRGNEHQQQQSPFRRGNGAPQFRGNGPYPHVHGGRREHERGNQDWNPYNNFNNRHNHMQSPRGFPRAFVPTQPYSSPQYMSTHLPYQSFSTPMQYHDMAAPYIYQGPPLDNNFRSFSMIRRVPNAVFIPSSGSQFQLQAIEKQIHYYFSTENLVKDTYLRQNMNEQGWVLIELIAGFRKVLELTGTKNVKLVKDALRNSNVVEIQGNKLRRRNDWMTWIMRPSITSPPSTSTGSVESMLANQLQGSSLDGSNER